MDGMPSFGLLAALGGLVVVAMYHSAFLVGGLKSTPKRAS